ncbi:MAG: hypothetical protein NC406_07580, partial [Bacteroides sp.]|nr:hypothetical protein [Bacteroides sp.]MCM1095720.1 hypothetical protein [Terasakiella sp.]
MRGYFCARPPRKTFDSLDTFEILEILDTVDNLETLDNLEKNAKKPPCCNRRKISDIAGGGEKSMFLSIKKCLKNLEGTDKSSTFALAFGN